MKSMAIPEFMAMHHLLWDDDPHLINNDPENDFVCTKSQWKKHLKQITRAELHLDFQQEKKQINQTDD